MSRGTHRASVDLVVGAMAIGAAAATAIASCASIIGLEGDYYEVGVIGYGDTVGPTCVGPIAGRELVSNSEIAENPARLEKRNRTVRVPGGSDEKKQSEKVPVWLEPAADGADSPSRSSNPQIGHRGRSDACFINPSSCRSLGRSPRLARHRPRPSIMEGPVDGQ